jgi:uncharacterized protein (DUF697 family)
MNHNYVTLGITAIIAAVALSAIGFALPQQALAYHHHNHNNGVKVDQQILQENFCTNQTECLNTADNQADIHR